jgi:hypothetical protein
MDGIFFPFSSSHLDFDARTTSIRHQKGDWPTSVPLEFDARREIVSHSLSYPYIRVSVVHPNSDAQTMDDPSSSLVRLDFEERDLIDAEGGVTPPSSFTPMGPGGGTTPPPASFTPDFDARTTDNPSLVRLDFERRPWDPLKSRRHGPSSTSIPLDFDAKEVLPFNSLSTPGDNVKARIQDQEGIPPGQTL